MTKRVVTVLACVLAASCAASTPPTEVLVVVRADDYVKAHATDLHLVVAGGTALGSLTRSVFDQHFTKSAAGMGEMGWPHTVALSPYGGDGMRFYEVQATATLDVAPTSLEARVVSGYLTGRVLVLYVDLDQSCIGLPCMPSETCRAGACTDPYVNPGTLHDLDGSVDMPGVDGGRDAAADLGMVDGGCTGDPQCDDHMFCNGVEHCVEGACQAATGGAPSCDDHVDCTVDSCDNAAGACAHMPSDALCTAATGGRCDVASGGCQYPTCTSATCTPADGCGTAMCAGSMCMRGTMCGTAEMCCGTSCVPIACEDHNPCTDDTCNAPTNSCNHTPNTAACSDGDVCTMGDACASGSCRPGMPRTCADDGNPCTDETCDAVMGCNYPFNTATCSDSNVCTVGDRCNGAGACAPGTGMMSCDDGVSCTHDSCAAMTGCSHVADSALCTATAGGTCNAVMDCQYPSCTIANCMPADACSTAVCSGSTCNRTSSCSGAQMCCDGMCVAPGCDDGNPCTADMCSGSGMGCTHFPVTGAATCDDGNSCTSPDFCSAGTCSGMPRGCDDMNPCTSDSCSSATGMCVHVPNDLPPCMGTDPCFNGDYCSGGSCHDGTLPACNDGSPCTTDSCIASGGFPMCVFTDTGACTTDGGIFMDMGGPDGGIREGGPG